MIASSYICSSSSRVGSSILKGSRHMLGLGQMAPRLPCGHDSLALSCHLCCRYFPSTLCIQKKMGDIHKYFICVPVLEGHTRIAVVGLVLLLVIGLWVILILISFFPIINFFYSRHKQVTLTGYVYVNSKQVKPSD